MANNGGHGLPKFLEAPGVWHGRQSHLIGTMVLTSTMVVRLGTPLSELIHSFMFRETARVGKPLFFVA